MVDINIKFYEEMSGIYDSLYDERFEEFNFYREIVSSADSVLEVACGSGTLTEVLTQNAASVVGIDASAEMLRRALLKMPQLSTEIADMRSFDLRRRFDLVVCSFNSLLHLDAKDIPSALKRFAAHVRKSGRVIVDVYNLDERILPAGGINIEKNVVDQQTGKEVATSQFLLLDSSRGKLIVAVTVKDRRNEQILTTSQYSLSVISPETLDLAFETAGLRIVEKYGTYDRVPFNNRHPKQIIVAERAAD
ncbi:putative N-methyltransferase [Roseibium sp. TrichSKD4]|uniref:class I SAM-dependent methyltransferase n=1 Tax=Roseibium sp. TrichSKD4 TaxID=744980 RepID=UPI0001E56AB6|nr:class I SAM-dependent methyltransferase [Roseibium sp. TrichSKD4]EFO31148.1 putative N-methyltransferase [Roseibium sp. TrichSKD4]